MEYGLIGGRLGHSFSKIIHNELCDYSYELCELSLDELDEFMRHKSFKGINVTIPYKREVIKYLDYVSDAARAIGAVNTVVNKGGRLYGYNTDCLGLKAAFNYHGVSLMGKKVAVLGTGGTSATAKYVAQNSGAERVLLVSRSNYKGDITYEQLYSDYSDTDVIINTTPSGMYPDMEGIPLDVSKFTRLYAVADAVYNPINTNLVLSAKNSGIKAFSGLYMLVSQAAFAAERFTDSDFTAKTVDIYKKILSEKLNIALIGMPSSGKSTIGKAIAEKLGKKFYDTDSMITEEAKTDISSIFSKFGEEYFRNLESSAVKKVSVLNNSIIATGGGAILRQDNVVALKRNSIVVFIDRPLEQLVGTADRPLCKDFEMLKKRYEERIDIYRSSADIIVNIGSDVASNVDAILDKLKNFGELSFEVRN